MAKLGEGHDRHDVESALALLKQSGDYDRVIGLVAAELRCAAGLR